jgi:myo-inositol-1(or 4)-monophosphatase
MADTWTTLTDFALSLAEASGQVILPHFRKNVEVNAKPHESWDPVTEGDRAGERIIRERIEKHYPSHGIIGEEFGRKEGTSGLTWILDPIDGTRAFISGLPTWGTLIALYEDGVPLIGVMHQPFTGEIFFGNPHGSWLQWQGTRQALRTRNTPNLGGSLAGTTSPHLFRGDNKAAFKRLLQKTRLMRYGGDCYFFSLVAGGHMDIALDPGLQIYDIAALIPIVTGAGGHVGSWTGTDPSKGGNVLAASNRRLFDEAIEAMG